jgi:hypothetical protein
VTLTDDTARLYICATDAAAKVSADIMSSADGLKKLYALRLKDEPSKKRWDLARRGYLAARDVHAKLLELSRQLICLTGVATLTEAECALFSYVPDPNALPLPEIDFEHTV